jgi:arylformamidase
VPDYAHLALDGAAYLAGVGVRTVGIDYLSIGHGEEGPPSTARCWAHRASSSKA